LELSFLDATHYIKPRLKAPQYYTKTMQGGAPHQVVDERYLNMMNDYYHKLRQARGFAEGGEVKAEPSHDEMLAHVMLRNMTSLKNVGANEAPNLKVKEYVAPGTGPGLPVGGVDFQPEMPGQQLVPIQPAAPMGAMPPQPGQPAGQMPPTGQPQGQPPAPAPGAPRSNILQMTQQGQALAAMRPNQPMPRMAGGGSMKQPSFAFTKHKHGEKVGGYHVGEKINNYGSYAASGIDKVLPGIHKISMSSFETTHPSDLFYAKNDHDRVHQLAKQIKQNGYLDPLLVAMDEKGPYVLEGGHRLGAAHLLGMKEIPAMIGYEPEVEHLAKKATGGPVYMGGGGSIKELEEYIRKHEGEYDAKRVQRAADEIPNLEDLYSLEALKHAFSGDNAQAMMTMNPAHFEHYASPIQERTKRWPGEESNKENLPTADYIRYLQSVGKFHDVPMLILNKEEAGLPLTPFISGHEGRHRSRAMAQAGQQKGLVRMLPRSELREPFPRRSREEYIEAMKKELAMTHGLVLPQKYSESKDEGWTETPVRRPAIKMPDIYAEGGDVSRETAEANKAKFLKGSKVPERVYHGTGNLENLQSFDPAMTGKGTDQLGSGFYFSNKPETASGYATSVTQNAAPGTPKLGGNTSPGMVAAHLAIKKPIKIGPKGNNLNDSNVKLTHDQVKRIIAHAPDLHNPDESPLANHFDLSKGVTPKMIHNVAQYYTGPQTLHMLENDMFPNNPTEYRQALHNVLGYDGVVKDFGNGEKHYVAWFPHQIKSAIGNRGTYDTSNPDITKAEGGVVKEKVTISPNMDMMQYELMGIKHLKKAK
jgi:hypothetical protein